MSKYDEIERLMNYQPPANFVYENAVNGLLNEETGSIQLQIEQKFGVRIDKAKLTHITNYERLQYLKGFIDGYTARNKQIAGGKQQNEKRADL